MPPTGTFDETFASTGVTEDQYLTTLKKLKAPIDDEDTVIETLNMFFAMSQSGLLPTWSYNSGLDTWSIAMDLYAFSDPRPAGSISGRFVATPAAVVPEPAALILAAQALFSPGRRGSLAPSNATPDRLAPNGFLGLSH